MRLRPDVRVAIVLTYVCTLVLAACAGSGPTRDTGPLRANVGDTGALGSVGFKVQANIPYEFRFLNVCTTGKPQRITKITVYRPSGGHLRVVDWGVSAVNSGTVKDGEESTVQELGGYGQTSVRAACGGPDFQLLAVSFATDSKRASIRGVLMHYAKDQTTLNPYGVALCVDRDCEPPDT